LDIKLSNGDKEVTLEGAGLPIGITGTATTERGKGASTVRFLIKGSDALGKEPLDTLSAWQWEDNRELTLHIGNGAPIDKCSLRECTLDLNAGQLYVGLYTSYPAQEVRHWFN
jgi:hypothetical protein